MKATALIVVLAAATALAGEPKCPDSSKESPLLSHRDCDKFYSCANGKPIVMRCPAGLLFNAATQECEYIENVDCGGRNSEETVPGVPEESEQEEDTPETNPEENVPPPGQPCFDWEVGNLYNHKRCDMFLQCDSVVLVEQRCPPGLKYNGVVGICDWPENVDCDNREFYPKPAPPVESAPETKPEENGPPTLPNCSEDGDLHRHSDCGKFYKCDSGIPVELNCPPGLHFNEEENLCDWPENANCQANVPVPPPQENSEEPTEASPEEGDSPTDLTCPETDGHSYIVHKDCNKYYWCINRVPVEQTCPGDLFWYPELERCDWSWNVVCGDRHKYISLNKHLEARKMLSIQNA